MPRTPPTHSRSLAIPQIASRRTAILHPPRGRSLRGTDARSMQPYRREGVQRRRIPRERERRQWREEVRQERLSRPFRVCHVRAGADTDDPLRTANSAWVHGPRHCPRTWIDPHHDVIVVGVDSYVRGSAGAIRVDDVDADRTPPGERGDHGAKGGRRATGPADHPP